MNYSLPTTVEIDDIEYKIRSDYRPILDILSALTDAELNDSEKAMVCLKIFYEDMPPREHWETALRELFSFISCGEDDSKKPRQKLMDWEQDFHLIIAPINKVAGYEIRSAEYIHWWTFIGYYNEIDGDCMFAQVVRIRDKKRRGKKLDESERRFYKMNASDIEFKNRYSEAEDSILKEWINGTGNTDTNRD